MLRTLSVSLLSALLLLASCSAPCTGHIEATVLYFKQAPQGQLAYVNVLNKPDLGSQQNLMRDDKEYGTFPHVIIINDPAMKFKGRRAICFDEFVKQPPPADVDLRELDIPRISITK
jgi:hypothetical protein